MRHPPRLPSRRLAGDARPDAARLSPGQGATARKDTDVNCIMLFLRRRAEPHRHLGPEAERPGRGARAVQADRDQRRRASQISEIFPKMAKHADKFSLVRSVYHTATAVHDTGHQMMQTGRLFTGGIEHPHVGCVARLPARAARRGAGPRAAAAADRPHRRQPAARPDRRLPRQDSTTRSSSTPTRRRPNFKVPDLLPPDYISRGAGRAPAEAARRRRWRHRHRSRRTPPAKQLDDNFNLAYRLMSSPQGPRGVRPRQGAGRGPRPLWPHALRPVLPAGPAADRSAASASSPSTCSRRSSTRSPGTSTARSRSPTFRRCRKLVAPNFDQAYQHAARRPERARPA